MADTPVGDWLRQRYPDNPGATHYLGTDGDPGCCAGPHPACTYNAGFREGAAAERERLYAELGNEHYVIFTEDRWTVEHSVDCKLSGHMPECDVHTAVANVTCLPNFQPQLGRWRVTGIASSGVPELEAVP